MPRYVTRTAWTEETPDLGQAWHGPLTPDLHVSGPKEVNTGLVDRHGNAIMRLQAPIGFGRDGEH